MADLLDILTEAEAQRAALSSDTTGHETQIARMVTAISTRIDEMCGPVVNRTVTEYHDGGLATIWPRQTPVSSVTTLEHWDGATTTTFTEDTWGTAGNVDGFLVEQSGSYAHDSRIYRRSSGSNALWPSGHRTIRLVYVAGRAATTDDVSAKFKECAADILRRAWTREAGAWARGGDPFLEAGAGTTGFFKAIDPMIAEWLRDELKPPGIA